MEPAGNKEEKMLNYDIGIALGEISVHLTHNLFCTNMNKLYLFISCFCAGDLGNVENSDAILIPDNWIIDL